MHFLILSTYFVLQASSASMVAKATEALQQGKKTQALQLLEKAFENSKDPEELRDIAVLTLEAAPKTYRKREAILKYLLQSSPQHADAYLWKKEMGDRALDQGKIDEASEWYYQALDQAPDKSLIFYKLAFVEWNQKRRLEAFRKFSSAYSTAPENLRAQIRTDMARLWMEIGPLDSEAWAFVQNLSSEESKELLEKLFSHLWKQEIWGSNWDSLIEQIYREPAFKDQASSFIQNKQSLKRSPCLPFRNLLTYEDAFSEEDFLVCLKSKDQPSEDRINGFFVRLENSDAEKVLWARSERALTAKNSLEAARILFKGEFTSRRSKDFLKYVNEVSLQLSEEELKMLYQEFGAEKFETLLKLSPQALLLERLQVIEPSRWLAFEESQRKGNPSSSFLTKKGLYLASLPKPNLAELQDIFYKLTEAKSHKKWASAYKQLLERAQTQLPHEFSKKFKTDFDRWIHDLDQSAEHLTQFPEPFRSLASPLFRQAIKENIESLLSQLKSVKLSDELKELSETFDQTRRELEEQIRRKYLEP